MSKEVTRVEALNKLKNKGIKKYNGTNIDSIPFKKLNSLYKKYFEGSIKMGKNNKDKPVRISIPVRNKNEKRKTSIKELFQEGIIEYEGTDLNFLEYKVLEDLYKKVFGRGIKNEKVYKRDTVEEFIYLIVCNTTKVCKVGFSNHPGRRKNALQTGYPYKLTLAKFFPGTKNDEKELHSLLNKHKLKGEWFNYNDEVYDIIKKYENQ